MSTCYFRNRSSIYRINLKKTRVEFRIGLTLYDHWNSINARLKRVVLRPRMSDRSFWWHPIHFWVAVYCTVGFCYTSKEREEEIELSSPQSLDIFINKYILTSHLSLSIPHLLWLPTLLDKNEKISHNFRPLNSLFDRHHATSKEWIKYTLKHP